MPLRRHSSLAVLCAVVLLVAVAPRFARASSSTVECGQLTGYTAPDPLGPTAGSLQLGFLDPWVVLATASVSPTTAAALPTGVGGGPTCLAVDRDNDGNISAIDFAPQGTISGKVTFDSASSFYVFADRLIVPSSVTDMYPGVGALFVPSYQAATDLTVTFSVDATTGGFAGFDGLAEFCGAAALTAGGDGSVGDAVIPGAVLDAADLAVLAGAGTNEACASIHSVGLVDPGTGDIQTTTDVTIVVDTPTPAATPTPPAGAAVATAAPFRPTIPPTDTMTLAEQHPGNGDALAAALAAIAAVVLIVVVPLRRRRGPSARN